MWKFAIVNHRYPASSSQHHRDECASSSQIRFHIMDSPKHKEEDTFRYNPLDLSQDAIRLIRLLSGSNQDTIACDLLEVLLGDTEGVPYTALSYTWGDYSDTRSIYLNGVRFNVTRNLHQALYNLRRQSEDRYLWVDAICIDQSNTNERSHQVGQMRHVYQHAENVIIWLGESSRDIDQLLESVNALDRRLLEDKTP